MLSLEDVLVSSYDIAALTVSWEIATTTETISDYVIDIMRSEDPVYSASGIFWVASGLDANDVSSYTDYTISGLDITNQWSYRNYYLQLRNTVTPATSDIYGPYKIETTRDLTAKEVIRRHALTLKDKYGGQPLLVLKRKTNGTHCTVCYDATLGRRSEEKCLTCYDTAWVGGYWAPLETQGMFNASPKRHQITVWGLWQPGDTILTMTNFPQIAPRDVIVDKINRRWNVVQIRTTEKGLYVMAQQAQLRLINKDDVIYSVAVASGWS
jgi:hypothetical protein